MTSDSQFLGLLQTRELQYVVAVAAVAVLVLLLLRRRPSAQTTALYLAGALLTLLSTPLIEASMSTVDRAIGTGSGEDIPGTAFWRVIVIGGAAGVLGVWCMARAWRDSPER